MKITLVFKSGQTEEFDNKLDFTKRIQSLKAVGVVFMYQLNGGGQKTYFEESDAFFLKLAELRQQKLGVWPMVYHEKYGWLKLNLFKKLSNEN